MFHNIRIAANRNYHFNNEINRALIFNQGWAPLQLYDNGNSCLARYQDYKNSQFPKDNDVKAPFCRVGS